MVQNLFKGYNVTVLAHIKTQSDMTHTMGTTYSTKQITRTVLALFPGLWRTYLTVWQVRQTMCTWSKYYLLSSIRNASYLLSNQSTKEKCIVDIRADAEGILVLRDSCDQRWGDHVFRTGCCVSGHRGTSHERTLQPLPCHCPLARQTIKQKERRALSPQSFT